MIVETLKAKTEKDIQNVIDTYYLKYPIQAYGTTHTQAWYDDVERKWKVKFNRSKNSD